MIKLLPLLVIAIFSYSFYQIFQKLAGGKADSSIVVLASQSIGLIIPLLFFVTARLQQKSMIPSTKEGIIFAFLSGTAISFFAISLARIFQKGGEVSVITPMIYGASMVLSIAFGIIFFHEKTTPVGMSGMLLVIVGLLMIAKANA